MSAGKSTLLNAMIGKQLLPSKCTACTASVFSITDIDGMKDFRVRARRNSKRPTPWKRATLPLLERMNESGYSKIEIEGDLKRIANYKKKFRVSFIDTPGPNNSCDSTHAELLHTALKSSDYTALIVVLNASTLRTTDEYNLLHDIAEYLKANRGTTDVLFVLNRIDAFFHGRQCAGSAAEIVEATQKFLTGTFGFISPIVMPVWSTLALECRQVMSRELDLMTEDDEDDLMLATKKARFHVREILEAQRVGCCASTVEKCVVTGARRKDIYLPNSRMRITVPDLKQAEFLSGVPAVEKWAAGQLKRHFKALETARKGNIR